METYGTASGFLERETKLMVMTPAERAQNSLSEERGDELGQNVLRLCCLWET